MEFIKKHCDPEYLSIYDIYWAGNDEQKMERIAELQEQALSLHSGMEAGQYAQEGLDAYTGIGQMYSGYLGRDTKEVRDKDDDRSQIQWDCCWGTRKDSRKILHEIVRGKILTELERYLDIYII